MKCSTLATLAVAGGMIAAASATAGIVISQGETGPTYTDFNLTFDEPGTPTGPVAPDAFQADYGLILEAGDGNGQVDDWGTETGQPWLGTGNSFFGNFGVFMSFDTDLTALSMQAWDPAGPPSPFGGGMGIFVFNDGEEIASSFVTPAWAGVGESFFDITVTDGMVFDEVRVLGFGFPNTTYADNISWNVVPSPAGLAVMGIAGLVGGRRRRR